MNRVQWFYYCFVPRHARNRKNYQQKKKLCADQNNAKFWSIFVLFLNQNYSDVSREVYNFLCLPLMNLKVRKAFTSSHKNAFFGGKWCKQYSPLSATRRRIEIDGKKRTFSARHPVSYWLNTFLLDQNLCDDFLLSTRDDDNQRILIKSTRDLLFNNFVDDSIDSFEQIFFCVCW